MYIRILFEAKFSVKNLRNDFSRLLLVFRQN